MIRYLLAFLLVNTYSRSFGVPVQRNITIPLANTLSALANRCENLFLSEQIKSKLNVCSIVVPPYNEKQFECLIFYDINRQLCDAVASSKLALTEDYTAKINEPEDVEKLCEIAKTWNIMNITEYPQYKKTVEKIFENSIACVKVCGVADILNEDTNYFCKYYKWGTEMLSRQVSTAPTHVDNVGPVLDDSAVKDDKNHLVAPINVNIPVNSINTTSDIKVTSQDLAPAATAVVKANGAVNFEINRPEVGPQTLTTSNVQPGVEIVNENPEIIPADTDVNVAKNKEKLVVVPEPIDPINIDLHKPEVAALPKKESSFIPMVNIEQPPNIPSQQKPPVLEKEKLQGSDPDDYQNNDDIDLEDGKGLADTGSDDGEDQLLLDPEIKPELLNSKTAKKDESSISPSFNIDKGYFTNTMPDEFVGDDDRFFPVFLTGVVLVVLLYVLYHNKNKVSKVILGLIVEGRQSGRRRNSRGHAYRRLDTLEQAMSSNSATPPSKIIY